MYKKQSKAKHVRKTRSVSHHTPVSTYQKTHMSSIASPHLSVKASPQWHKSTSDGSRSRRMVSSSSTKSPSVAARRSFAMKVFNPATKLIQRKAAVTAPDALDFNYLRAESARRVMDRLSIVRYPFENTVLLGTDAGALASEITRRHVGHVFEPYTPIQFSESTLEVLSKTTDGNLDELSESERMPTQEQIMDALRHMERYAIKDLQTLTVIDPLPEAIQLTKQEIDKYMEPLVTSSPKDIFKVQTLCTPLATIPIIEPPESSIHDTKKGPNATTALEPSNPSDITVNQMYKGKTQLVMSNLTLHWENDLPAIFKQAHDLLEPNGAFIGAMIGGETLRELRSALTVAEMERRGGVSHHISPFTLTKDVGDLMTKVGFEMVSVDVDTINIPYPDMFTLAHHLQKMGEQHAPFNVVNKVPRDVFIAAASIYDALYRNEDGLLNCNVDILMFIGWKYHASMNPKAKRGSATAKIGDIVEDIPITEFESYDAINLKAPSSSCASKSSPSSTATPGAAVNLHRVAPPSDQQNKH